MVSKATPDSSAARRQRAHDELDRYLDELLARESGALASDSPREARELLRNGLDFLIRVMGTGIPESAAPKILGNSPSEIRRALRDIIGLLWPVWPSTNKTAGLGPYSGSIWPSDVIHALEKLDGGEIMPVFEVVKRPGKAKWTEQRFHFLAALWAIHLERSKLYGPDEANNLVAHAFNPAIATVTPDAVRVYDPNSGKIIKKLGGLPQGSLRRWRRHFEAVAAGRVFDEVISRADAKIGIYLASSLLGDLAAEACAQHLHIVVFGVTIGGSKSLAEAGRRYQEFKTLKKSDPVASEHTP